MIEEVSAHCCVVGGGVGGTLLGLLLARAGLAAVVLEAGEGSTPESGGEVVHPSTLGVLSELELLDDLLKVSHDALDALTVRVGRSEVRVADLPDSDARRFIRLESGSDLLGFLAERATRFASLRVVREAEVGGLVRRSGKVCGVRACAGGRRMVVRADLVVGADGPRSVVRRQAHLPCERLAPPLEVLWFRLPRDMYEFSPSLGYFDRGQALLAFDRGDHWLCGYVIPRGTREEFHQRGFGVFREAVGRLTGAGSAGLPELEDWSDIRIGTLALHRSPRWYRDGVLCIGEAAHATWPIAGIGLNLEIQDAVAAANLLARPLREGRLSVRHLRSVQRRRAAPARMAQWVQCAIQKRVFRTVWNSPVPMELPLAVRLLSQWAYLRRLHGRALDLPMFAEHVRAA